MKGQLLLGTFGAIAGALIGAVAWAVVSATTNFQIGYMAVGVGFLAGAGMRIFGGGRDPADGYVAGAIALVGCVLGNLFTIVVVIAQHEHYPILETIVKVLAKPALTVELLREDFNVMDVLFYALAIYAGYRTARKAPEPQQVATTHTEPPATTEPITPP